jgi:hypothetical protein
MNPKGSAQKNIGYSYGSYRKYFFANAQQTTQKTTYFRMYYLSQPIAGFIH